MKNNTATITLLAAVIFLVAGCKSAFQAGMDKFNMGEYNSAIPKFEKALRGQNDIAKIGEYNFQVAESYRLSNRGKLALPYYEQAIKAGYGGEHLGYYYAQSLKANGNYQAAGQEFAKYMRDGTSLNFRRVAKSEVDNLARLDTLMQPNPDVLVTNCENLNSPGSEYSPVVFDNKLYFTSSRGQGKVYEATGTRFTDVYFVEFDSATGCPADAPQAFEPAQNLPGFHEASVTFSSDGKLMVFARSNSGKKRDENMDVNLYMSKFDGSRWSEPEILSICSPNYWDACPMLSPDGQTLYFASNRPGGVGGTDIWRAERSPSGQFIRPENLGREVNTPGNELFPYVSENRNLYFASDGHPGLGGLDLFRAVAEEGEIFVTNLGAPYNSTADDFALIYTAEKRGFFCSNRETEMAKGDDDLYYFIDETPETYEVRYLLAGISLSIENGPRETLPQVNMELVGADGKVIEKQVSDKDGRFQFETFLEIGQEYTVKALKDRYDPASLLFPTAGREAKKETLKAGRMNEIVFETEIVLDKDTSVFALLLTGGGKDGSGGDGDNGDGGGGKDGNGGGGDGLEVVLDNILYDLNDSRIRSDAALELDKLVAFLKRYPDIRVELGSHTDSRASVAYNQRLSQQRAQSAVDYIVAQGVSRSRIEAKGYGKSRLRIENARNEAEHQLNRRTTVRVIGRGLDVQSEE